MKPQGCARAPHTLRQPEKAEKPWWPFLDDLGRWTPPPGAAEPASETPRRRPPIATKRSAFRTASTPDWSQMGNFVKKRRYDSPQTFRFVYVSKMEETVIQIHHVCMPGSATGALRERHPHKKQPDARVLPGAVAPGAGSTARGDPDVVILTRL